MAAVSLTTGSNDPAMFGPRAIENDMLRKIADHPRVKPKWCIDLSSPTRPYGARLEG